MNSALHRHDISDHVFYWNSSSADKVLEEERLKITAWLSMRFSGFCVQERLDEIFHRNRETGKIPIGGFAPLARQGVMGRYSFTSDGYA